MLFPVPGMLFLWLIPICPGDLNVSYPGPWQQCVAQSSFRRSMADSLSAPALLAPLLHSQGHHASSRLCPVACRRLSIPVMGSRCLGLAAGLARLSHNWAVTGGSSGPVPRPRLLSRVSGPHCWLKTSPASLRPLTSDLSSFTDVSPSKISCTSEHVLGAALGRTQARQRPPSYPLPRCSSYSNWGISVSDFSLYAGRACMASRLERPRGSDGHCFLHDPFAVLQSRPDVGWDPRNTVVHEVKRKDVLPLAADVRHSGRSCVTSARGVEPKAESNPRYAPGPKQRADMTQSCCFLLMIFVKIRSPVCGRQPMDTSGFGLRRLRAGLRNAPHPKD